MRGLRFVIFLRLNKIVAFGWNAGFLGADLVRKVSGGAMEKTRLKVLCMTGLGFFILFRFHAGAGSFATAAEAPTKLFTIEEFIVQAVRNDAVFEEILIDELRLKYEKALKLPAGDIVVSVKSRYNFLLSHDDEEPDLTVGLSKLFPYTGTDVSTSYSGAPSLSSGNIGSEFNVLISQPIAQNAFGRSFRLQDHIVGMEIDVARYQVIEAYEDYLASLLAVYYDWYSAYEDMKISESSYHENSRLLENMLERSRQNIALPVDVNKVRLLVLAKEDRLIQSRQAFEEVTNMIKRAVRYDGSEALKPADPFEYHRLDVDFDRDYQSFVKSSRTYGILSLLEIKSSLEVEKSADDLLPSTNVLIGYRSQGDQWKMKDEDDLVYAGISFEWPFWDQAGRAEHAVSKIDQRQRQIKNQNKYIQLYTDLRNIHDQIRREETLIRVSDERIALAESVLEDESRNYSYGKISLNDYIDAVNKLDEYRFSRTTHAIQLHKLLTEWLRLTDRLVGEEVLMAVEKK